MEKVQDIVKYINEHFNDLPSDFKIEVPPSTLPPNMDIDAQKLFKSPNFNDEMESISHDKEGKRIRLNDAQLVEIARDGTFTVLSKMYAGMDNRFRVSPLLQKGQDNIDAASHKNKVAALSNIVVDAPGALSTNTINVKDGLLNIWKGIAGIPVLLFGNRAMKHAHSEREIKDAADAAQEDRLVVKFVDLSTKIANIAEVYHEIGKGDHHYYSFRVTNFEKLRALDIPPVADADQLYAFLKEKLSKKDAKMFIDQLTFVASVKEKLAARDADRKQFVEEGVAAYKAAHSLLADIPSMLNKKIDALGVQYDTEHPCVAFQETLKIHGVTKAARLYQMNCNIAETVKDLRAVMESEMVPATTSDWSFFGQEFETTTRYPGWRVFNGILRVPTVLYHVGRYAILNLWDGNRFSFCSWLPKGDFDVYETITKRNKHVNRRTVWGKFVAVWQNAFHQRKKYVDAPSTGILGKGFMDAPNWFYNFIIKGLCGSIASVLFHLVVSILNAILDVVVIASSPVVSIVAALFSYVFEILVYDFSAPTKESPRWFPLFNLIIKRFAVQGVGQVVLALLLLCCYLILGVARFAINGVWVGAREMYDHLMMHIVIAPRAFIPTRDQDGIFGLNLTKRFQGAGVSVNTFYLLPPKLGAFLFSYRLEQEELRCWEQSMNYEIEGPLRDLDRFLNSFENAGLTNNHNTNKHVALRNTRKRRRDDMYVKLKVHHAKMNVQGSIGGAKLYMRKEVLDAFIAECDALCKEFVQRRVFSYVDEKEFWKSQCIHHDDADRFNKLTRAFLKDCFGPSILIPLEEMDQRGFRLKIQDVSFAKVTGDILLDGDVSDVVMTNTPVFVKEPTVIAKKRTSYTGIEDLHREAYGGPWLRLDDDVITRVLMREELRREKRQKLQRPLEEDYNII